MSYTPTTWTTGDTITASAMNKIEQGVANAGSALIVQYDSATTRLTKTANEIYSALSSGIPVYITWVYGEPTDYLGNLYYAQVVRFYTYDYANIIRIVATYSSWKDFSQYTASFAPATMIFSAESMSDYPRVYVGLGPTTVERAY